MDLLILVFIFLIPLISFLSLSLATFIPEKICGRGATVGMALSFVGALALFLFDDLKPRSPLAVSWIDLGEGAKVSFGLLWDGLSSLMVMLVTFVSLMVHIFSLIYMKDDPQFRRYFALLGFFSFAMLGLVLANNLLLLYCFWELVGLSSYLLIGFWYQKRSAYRAAKKAFLVNRLGDIGLLIGLILSYLYFGSWEIDVITTTIQDASLAFDLANWELGVIALCLFLGAMAKSAQFPLHFWLPDAMEGPTPVSALIHAATMVAAGVYLMARFYFLVNLDVGIGMAFIGGITVFLGAFSALVQNDIKKVLAYSTISQLGYMMMALGVGAYSAGLFHLFTHAFFKAGLFLGAGAIIHSLHALEKKLDFHFDPQNIYLMGGLRKKLPFVFVTFSICALSLCGLPLFSGFLSKDAILVASWAWAETLGQGGSWLFYLVPGTALLGVFLTALYMGRLLWLVFGGSFMLDKLYRRRKKAFSQIEEVPMLMKIPLGILAFMSLAFVFSLNPFNAEASWLLEVLVLPEWGVLSELYHRAMMPGIEKWHFLLAVLSTFLALAGLLTSFFLFRNNRYDVKTLTLHSRPLYHLARESFLLDRLYQQLAQEKGLALANAIQKFDKKILDGFVNFFARFQVVFGHLIAWIDKYIVDGLVLLTFSLVDFSGYISRSFQGGKLQGYFAFTLFFFIIVLFYIFFI